MNPLLSNLLFSAIGPLMGLFSGPPGYEDLPAPLRTQVAQGNQAGRESLARGQMFEREARNYATTAGQNAQQAGPFDPSGIEGLGFLAPIVDRYQNQDLFGATRGSILSRLLPQTTAFTNPVLAASSGAAGGASSQLLGAQSAFGQGIGQGVGGIQDALLMYMLQDLFMPGSPTGGE